MATLLKANRALWNGHFRRVLLLKWTFCAGLLGGMLLCPRLWTADRAFPTVPLLPGLPDLPALATLALAGLLVLALLLAAVLPYARSALLAALLSGAILVLFDVNRLQPWFYQAMLGLLALSLVRWDRPESSRAREAWALVGFLLVATYFWSGVGKANPAFAVRVFPWLLGSLAAGSLRSLAFVAPLVEVAISGLLVVPRGRAWGLGLLLATHALLLVALGLFGSGYNSVVWPWNVAMPALAFAAFFRNPEPLLPPAWRPPLGRAFLLFVGLLPALNILGLWDDDLSFALYSGRSRQAFLLLTEAGARRLPARVRPYLLRRPDRLGLDLVRWPMDVLNVPPYPEVRVYVAVARSLRRSGVPAAEMTLVVSDRPTAGRTVFRRIAIP